LLAVEDVEDGLYLIDESVDASAESLMVFDPETAVHFVAHDLILSEVRACGLQQVGRSRQQRIALRS
jgi:hypothetical protein